MKEHLHIPMSLKEDEHSLRLVLEIDSLLASEWRTALQSLQARLLHQITIIDFQNTIRIRLKINTTIPKSSRALYRWKDQLLDLEITLNELDYWIIFIDKYISNGKGDVDHIDLDISANKGKKELFLVIKIPVAEVPVSAREAKRRLRKR